VEPKLNSRRASLVLSKIDEILAWEKSSDRERDTQFVELGRYLCEVRSAQYWRLDNLRSFDELYCIVAICFPVDLDDPGIHYARQIGSE
jgi:hypothetical protein